MTAEQYRELILNFISSLCLCDHMGDVGDDIVEVLEKLGLEYLTWDELSDLRRGLVEMGFKGLYQS